MGFHTQFLQLSRWQEPHLSSQNGFLTEWSRAEPSFVRKSSLGAAVEEEEGIVSELGPLTVWKWICYLSRVGETDRSSLELPWHSFLRC